MSESPWLTTEEAAAYLRVSADYIRRQCAKGTIPARLIGGRNGWLITREALDAFMSPAGPAPVARSRRRAR